MKILIFSDVHGNKNALDALLFYMRENNFSHSICLGDIVGYGEESEYCVQTIRKLQEESAQFLCVSGNHDAAAAGKLSTNWFSKEAKKSVMQTRKKLSAHSLSWLSALPVSMQFDYTPTESLLKMNALIVHGSPLEPLTEYIWGDADTLASFWSLTEQNILLCFCGHTHEASLFSNEVRSFDMERIYPHNEQKIYLTKEKAASGCLSIQNSATVICNPGSIGEPRFFAETMKNKSFVQTLSLSSYPAFFAVFDTDEMSITFKSIHYKRK